MFTEYSKYGSLRESVSVTARAQTPAVCFPDQVSDSSFIMMMIIILRIEG